MLNIKIICVGKLSNTSLKELSCEYLKRLQKYAKVDIIEIQDEKLDTSSVSLEEKIKDIESKKILEKLDKLGKCTIITLDLKGKMLDSIELAKKISYISTYESSTIAFVIGGSLGFNDEVRQRANYSISFSKLTFPHQLIRIFLYEQLFRSFKILNNETYHHEQK